MIWAVQRMRQERDHSLARVAQLEVRLQEASDQRDELRGQLIEARQALARVVDNALFAAGCPPVFEPDAQRFQPRGIEQQQAEAQKLAAAPPLSPAEWRRRVEEMDHQAAERDRKARLREELRRVADEERHKGAAHGGKDA